MPEKIQFADVMATFKRVVNNVLAQYKMIIKVTTLTTLITLGYGLIQPPNYTAVATFILEDKSSSKSGLGAIASQIGFDIGGLTGGNAGLFDGDNILDIMQSRLIIEKVLLSKLDSNAKNQQETLADIYARSNRLNKKWNADNGLENFKFKENANSELQDSLLYTLVQRIVKKNLVVSRQNKKGSIISIQVNSNNQQFSKLFSERLLKQTSDLYIGIKTGNLTSNIEKLQRKADSLQRSLYTKSFEASNLLNANAGIKTYTVHEDLSQKDKTMVYTLFVEVTKNLEALKLSQINQTPVIQVLDMAKYPLVNQATPLFIIVLIGVAVGLVLSILIAVYLYTDKIN